MTKNTKKLFLLDAMALIYRAHFAFSKNPIINAKGRNTGAILGFTNSLWEIIYKEKPTHIAVAFDTAAPTFRHVVFPTYKAQRQEQPEDIRASIPFVKDIIRAFNIPVLELDSYEADDIIGTFSSKACTIGFDVYMMTPDKDFGQLVNDCVKLYKPAYMGNAVDILGEKEVLEKWGIRRIDQVRDMLGLQGDAVDNIPGIPGIGAKTAIKLIEEFDTIEGIIANVDKLKGKLKERVLEFGEQGILSKELATINTAVPIAFDEEKLRYIGPDEDSLRQLFNELEFRTLAKRVFGEAAPQTQKASAQMSMFDAAATPEAAIVEATDLDVTSAVRNTIHTVAHHYQVVDTQELRKSLVEYLLLQEEFCFDTETTSVDAIEANLVGLSFSYYASEAYYIPVPPQREAAQRVLEDFREVLENEKISKIGHNLKFDILLLKKYGIEVQGVLFDTMLAHYLLEPEARHKMDIIAENLLNYKPVPIEDLIGKKGKKQGNMEDVALDTIADYAAEDADITLQLKYKLQPALEKNKLQKLYEEVEGPLLKVLASMEFEGIKIDTATLAVLSKEMEEDIKLLEKDIYAIAGEEFNIGSPKQLGEILFDKLLLDKNPKKTKTGQYATGEDILSRLACDHKICRHITDFRELQKLKSTYIDALPTLISPGDGRIHTCYNQAVAATGRLSSTNPNLQNIPIRTEKGREIRKAFIPRSADYVLMAADYSQIELRIMAAFSQDESMIEAFKNGRDIHATTAAKIFKVPLEAVDADMRRKAKTANFGIIYGISAFGLAQRLEIPRKEAGEIIAAYFEEFPAVKQYMDAIINLARENEYVETILGRKRYLPDINSRNFTMRGFAERNAINAPIQGSAADIIKVAMVNIQAWMEKKKLKSRMILQVHDELVFDVHKDEVTLMKVKINELMKNALEIEVPMEIGTGVGNNWLEAH